MFIPEIYSHTIRLLTLSTHDTRFSSEKNAITRRPWNIIQFTHGFASWIWNWYASHSRGVSSRNFRILSPIHFRLQNLTCDCRVLHTRDENVPILVCHPLLIFRCDIFKTRTEHSTLRDLFYIFMKFVSQYFLTNLTLANLSVSIYYRSWAVCDIFFLNLQVIIISIIYKV